MSELAVERYLAALDMHRDRAGGVVTPSLLAAACVDVLPVDGAGISLAQNELRVPLGWTNETVALAERIQTTLGDGPCLSASDTGEALLADDEVVARRWPVYHQQLRDHTPFASVAAVPLAQPGLTSIAALNLYATRPDLSAVLPLEQATVLAEHILIRLLGLLDTTNAPGPVLGNEFAEDRMRVWQAVGMVLATTPPERRGDDGGVDRPIRLDDRGTLALLRGYAFSRDMTLDQVATRIVERDLDPADILI